MQKKGSLQGFLTSIPVLGRRFLGMFFEKLGKIVGVLDAHAAGHLINSQIRSLQKLFGCLDADGYQIVHKVDSHNTLEGPAEIRVVDIVDL